jgi:hypothetical protein
MLHTFYQPPDSGTRSFWSDVTTVSSKISFFWVHLLYLSAAEIYKQFLASCNNCQWENLRGFTYTRVLAQQDFCLGG